MLGDEEIIMYKVIKTYGHERGISCAFRQWKATHSHCQFIHGYALQFEICFASEVLDARGWVIDFGGLDEIKDFLINSFDHKLMVARDDPKLDTLKELYSEGVVDLHIINHVGCEAFAEYVFNFVKTYLSTHHPLVSVEYVKISEHGANSAIFDEGFQLFPDNR